MRRRWVWIAGCLSVVVVVSLLFLALFPPDRVTIATYNAINAGMSEAAVERLLGRPADETVVEEGSFMRGRVTYTSWKTWARENGGITVFFRDGVVVGKVSAAV